MADFNLTFDAKGGGYDLSPNPTAQAAPGSFMAADLRTAVLASLLTWGRVDAADPLPDFSGDLKGWWGDAWPRVAGDRIGSRLWVHLRTVLTEDVMERARLDGEAALAWLIEDGLASRVVIQASRPAPTKLVLDVTIYRPDGQVFRLGVDLLWPK